MGSNHPVQSLPVLSLSAAQHALAACVSRAESLSVPVNISIYDSTLHLLAFARMSTAKLTSIDIAHNKAFTAAGHRLETDKYGERVNPGGPLFGVQHSNDGKFCTIGGGVPILVDGVCVGGIGVSGGLPSEDKDIALAGVEAVLSLTQMVQAKL